MGDSPTKDESGGISEDRRRRLVALRSVLMRTGERLSRKLKALRFHLDQLVLNEVQDNPDLLRVGIKELDKVRRRWWDHPPTLFWLVWWLYFRGPCLCALSP